MRRMLFESGTLDSFERQSSDSWAIDRVAVDGGCGDTLVVGERSQHRSSVSGEASPVVFHVAQTMNGSRTRYSSLHQTQPDRP